MRTQQPGLRVGVYDIRGDKIVRSQMFHADSAAVARFLKEAGRP